MAGLHMESTLCIVPDITQLSLVFEIFCFFVWHSSFGAGIYRGIAF